MLGADGVSRYSGARRGIGHQGALGAPRGVGWLFGVSEGVRGCRVIRGVLGGWQGLQVLRGQKGY